MITLDNIQEKLKDVGTYTGVAENGVYIFATIMETGLTCEVQFDPQACSARTIYTYIPSIDTLYWPYIDDTDADENGHKKGGWTTIPYKGNGIWQDNFVEEVTCNSAEALSDHIMESFRMVTVLRNVRLIDEHLLGVKAIVDTFPLT